MKHLLLAMSLLLGVTACGSDDTGQQQQANTSGGTSGGAGRVGCATDPRVTPFTTNMVATSQNGRLTAEIMNADPAPPRHGAGEAGQNVWTMKLTLDGQVPADVSKITPSTLMPDHGHGSPKGIILSKNEDGTFTAKQVFLFMAGVWEVTFAPADAAPTDVASRATFRLCLDTV